MESDLKIAAVSFLLLVISALALFLPALAAIATLSAALGLSVKCLKTSLIRAVS